MKLATIIDVHVDDRHITLTLSDSRIVAVPTSWSRRLAGATEAERADRRIDELGIEVEWPAMEVVPTSRSSKYKLAIGLSSTQKNGYRRAPGNASAEFSNAIASAARFDAIANAAITGGVDSISSANNAPAGVIAAIPVAPMTGLVALNTTPESIPVAAPTEDNSSVLALLGALFESPADGTGACARGVSAWSDAAP